MEFCKVVIEKANQDEHIIAHWSEHSRHRTYPVHILRNLTHGIYRRETFFINVTLTAQKYMEVLQPRMPTTVTGHSDINHMDSANG